MTSIRFEVDHLDHGGDLVATIENPLDVRWQYVMKEPGDVFYGVALSDPVMTTDQFRPKITDWQLNMVVDDTDVFPLAAGIHDQVNFQSRTGIVPVTGRDWLMWLDQPYPFDGYEGFTDLDDFLDNAVAADFTNGMAGKQWAGASGATQEIVVSDLIAPLIDSGYGTDPILITPAFNGSAWGESIDWGVYFQDSVSVLDHIRAISDVYSPRGFDFWMEWDKTLRLEGPRLIDPASVTPIYFFHDDSESVVDVDWTNRGPRASEVIGFGSGSGNVRGFHRKTDVDNIAQFRKWLLLVNFQSPSADLTSANLISSLVNEGEYLEPQKELRLTVKPEYVDTTDETAGFLNFLGEAVDVDLADPWDPYHRIDASFYVVGQNYYPVDGSNYLCDLTLAQVY